MASINRGDNTGAFGKEFLRIYINNPNNLYIQKAVFQINGCLEKEYFEPKFPLKVNFTGEETELLHQVNECRLALWDEYGRRRTADGKFTFFVKENRIKQPDAPVENMPTDEDVNVPSITFDLDEAEFAAQFVVDATPTKMSELQQDIYLFTPDKIVDGENIHTYMDGDKLVINALLDPHVQWADITGKPTINGMPLEGNVEIHLEQEIPNADWKATSGPAAILNKPNFADVAYTGRYSTLLDKPQIPTKTSDLQNDDEFITNRVSTLVNYYNKEQVDKKVDFTNDFTEINNKITANKQETDEKIVELQYDINSKVTQTQLNEQLADKVNTAQLQDAVDGKLDRRELGNGRLNITINNVSAGSFAANQTTNSAINIDIPTKLSELFNDTNFVTQEQISFDNLVTRDELNTQLEFKADETDIGHGIATFNVNGEKVGTFSANAQGNKNIDIHVPTNVSDLINDSGFIDNTQLDSIHTDISNLQADINILGPNIQDLQSQVDLKVDKQPGMTLMSTTEVERLSQLHDYDDTEIRQGLEDVQNKIITLDDEIATKQSIEAGKGLSTNDFTDYYKQKLDNSQADLSGMQTQIDETNNKIIELNDKTTAIDTEVEELNVGLQDEIATRQEKYNYLQQQIEGMTAKATVVDIVQSTEDLDTYDTSVLREKDVICVLKDDTKNNTTTYYRWNGSLFTFIGSEGEYYTKSEANELFVEETRKINGYTLNEDITLSASDVRALPEDTVIGNGTLTIQVNGQQLGTFTSNQETNRAIDIPVPTTISQLENDIQFVDQDKLDSELITINDSLDAMEESLDLANTRLDTLQGVITGDVSGLAEVAFTNNYNSLDGLPTIPTAVSQLENDVGYVFTMGNEKQLDVILTPYALKSDIPVKVSEVENDRGYVTNNAIGRGILTIQLQNKQLGTWMANEKDDYTITIPLDNQLSTTSENPVQNNIITNEMNQKAYDNTVVHLAGQETITGGKIFTGIVDLQGESTCVTQAIEDNTTKIASTAYVKNQDYCTNTDAVHKAQDETITGNKTFTGNVTLNNATGVTVINTDNSNNLATTKFVKDQDYAVNSETVHNFGDETINGDKTFAETTTFVGITYLGRFCHVVTPDENDETNDYEDLVTNVQFVNDKIATVNTRIDNEVQTLETSITNNVETLNNTITSTQNTLQGNINTLSQTVTSNYTSLDGRITTLNNNLQNYYTKSEVDNLLTQKDTTISQLQQLITQMQQQITSLEQRVTALEPEQP